MGALTYEHSVNHDAYELNMHIILSYNVAGSKVDNILGKSNLVRTSEGVRNVT